MNPSGPSRRHVLGAADPATRLLETTPNVGPRTAETFAARLHDPMVSGGRGLKGADEGKRPFTGRLR
jgi:hypothetical protein